MSEVNTAGNVVWDPKSTFRSENSIAILETNDPLPSFSLLKSDEERERKAETSMPGTYHVVLVPESFSSLPEYSQGSSDRGPRDSVAAPSVSQAVEDKDRSCANEEDTNVVIVDEFQDTPRRPSSHCRSSTLSPTSDMLGSLSPTIESYITSQDVMQDHQMHLPGQFVEDVSQEATLLQHFRQVVWKQLFPGEPLHDNLGDHSLSAEVFEREAAEFPPLFHAMMAVSALSLAHQDGSQNMDALQYYQQAFPSLQNSIRSSEDLLSDGLFLTHFLLLVYEIAAAEPSGSNLWSHHISRLLHISILRRSTLGAERYSFVIWWVCNIDLYALLSGAGTGEFIGAMIENHLLPEAGSLLYPAGNGGYSVIYPQENDSLPILLRLYHDTFILSFQLGFLGAEIRRSIKQSSFMFIPSDRQQREISGIQEAFRGLWESPNIQYLLQTDLPKRSKDILQQSSALLHTALLFSHTSMWPGQHLGPEAFPEDNIYPHVTAILQIAESAIAEAGGAGQRFVTFPLFLAGAVTTSHEQKMVAMELLSNMTREEMGYNAATTRYILQVVYEQQAQRLMSAGHALNVDWVDIMDQHDLQVVNFG
ncbi:hypothetical protein AWENTII_008493 [Aspergillus wentii]